MIKGSKLAVIALAAVVGLAGCSIGMIRVVHKVPQGGEVALMGTPEASREKADGYMRSHCPSGYDVVEEYEAVVGQQYIARSDAHPRRDMRFGPSNSTYTRAETRDKVEWRIRYQCRAAPAGAPASFPAVLPERSPT